jgi:hypothetical protein
LLRPEGAVLFVIWSVVLVLRYAARDVARWASWFVIPFVATEVFRIVYFGAFVPNSVRAKSGYSLGAMLSISSGSTRTFFAQYGVVVLGALLAVVASRRIRRPIIPATIGFIAVFGALVELHDGYAGLRYYFPVVPVLFAATAAGAASLLRLAARRPSRAVPVIAVVLVLGTLTSTGVVWAQQSKLPLRHRLDIARGLGRLTDLTSEGYPQHVPGDYRPQLAAWLAAHGNSGDVVALDEIGVVAYHGRVGVLDLWGLGDTHIASLPGKAGRKADPNYVFDRSPRYIAFLFGGCLCPALVDDRAYAEDPRMSAYNLVFAIPPGSHAGVLLYERRPNVVGTTSLAGDAEHITIPRAAIAAALSQARSPSALAALGDLVRLQTVNAVPVAGHDAARPVRIPVSVRAGTFFEADLGDIAAHGGGTWTLSVDSDGKLTHLASVRAMPGREPSFDQRVTASLGRWAGKRVAVRVSFEPDCVAPGCGTYPLLVEPRAVRVR